MCTTEIPRRDNTFGIVPPNEELAMPAFAVDVIGGQGNGDVTDAVIALRGAIANDGCDDYEIAAIEQRFVALSSDEAEVIYGILQIVAGREPEIDVVEAIQAWAWRRHSGADTLAFLSERIKMCIP